MKDSEGKNAIIDSVCEILQSHKDVPVVNQEDNTTTEEEKVVALETENAIA
jgi:hypothetical protein